MLNVLGCRHGGAVAVAGVVVSAIKLIHDERCTVTADVLDLSKFRILHNLAGWIPTPVSPGTGRAADRDTLG